jgi:hypothetical protein
MWEVTEILPSLPVKIIIAPSDKYLMRRNLHPVLEGIRGTLLINGTAGSSASARHIAGWKTERKTT